MKRLSSDEIAKFANKVENPTPVWNFLGTCHYDNYLDALANLEMDTKLYNWPEEVSRAIYNGLKLANS